MQTIIVLCISLYFYAFKYDPKKDFSTNKKDLFNSMLNNEFNFIPI